MSIQERISKIFFGVLLILSFFVQYGRWIALILGVVFLASALYGFCYKCQCQGKCQ